MSWKIKLELMIVILVSVIVAVNGFTPAISVTIFPDDPVKDDIVEAYIQGTGYEKYVLVEWYAEGKLKKSSYLYFKGSNLIKDSFQVDLSGSWVVRAISFDYYDQFIFSKEVGFIVLTPSGETITTGNVTLPPPSIPKKPFLPVLTPTPVPETTPVQEEEEVNETQSQVNESESQVNESELNVTPSQPSIEIPTFTYMDVSYPEEVRPGETVNVKISFKINFETEKSIISAIVPEGWNAESVSASISNSTGNATLKIDIPEGVEDGSYSVVLVIFTPVLKREQTLLFTVNASRTEGVTLEEKISQKTGGNETEKPISSGTVEQNESKKEEPSSYSGEQTPGFELSIALIALVLIAITRAIRLKK